MKRMKKVLSTLFIALLMLLPFSTSVSAQEIDMRTLLEEIANSQAEPESAAVDGNFAFNFQMDESQGEFSGIFEGVYNVDPRFSFDGNLDFHLFSQGIENQEDMDESHTLALTVLEGFLYAFDGENWNVDDISEQEQVISQSISEAMQGQGQAVQTMLDNPELIAFNEKYLNVEETETEYIFTMTPDFDPNELIADLNTAIDLDALLLKSMEESANVMDEEKQMTEEEKQMALSMGKDMLAFMVSGLKNYQAVYEKDTYRMKSFVMDFELTGEDIRPLLGSMGADAMGNFLGKMHMEMNFSNYGEVFEVVKPDVPEGTEVESFTDNFDSEESEETTEEVSDEVGGEEVEESEQTDGGSTPVESEEEAEE